MPLNQHLRELWGKAGLPRTAGSAGVIPPPLAGYRPAYHLTSAEYAISNIVFSRLKVARLSDLNDPFELLALTPRSTPVRKILLAHKDKLNREKGLVCFSADWLDPVLWSHYGAKYRGIFLGFRVATSIAHEVAYQTERLDSEKIGDLTSVDEELGDLLLCTKFSSWRYEQEWRVLVSLADAKKEGDHYFYNFGQELQLAEVILGPLCDLSLREVRKLTQTLHPDAVTYRSRLAINYFSIVPKEDSVPICPANS